MSTGWIDLDIEELSHITNITKINDETFIVGHLNKTHSIQKGNGIYQYCMNTNKWSKFITYTKSIRSRVPSIIWNKKTQKLWMIGDDDDSEKSDIFLVNKQDIDEIHHAFYIGESPNILLINDKYHVIGGSDNQYHLIWNEKKQTFDKKHQFIFDGNLGHRTIYIESKKIMLMFGGYDYINDVSFDSIYQFSLDDDKWILLENIKLPQKYHGFGCIMTSDQRYIIFLGGNIENNKVIDTIYIMDLNTMSFKISNIVCPQRLCYHAILMTDKYKQQLLAFGYLRREFDKNKLILPVDIINLVAIWISVEWIHLLSVRNAKHWKIAVDHILSSGL